jgi:hypothetical protein
MRSPEAIPSPVIAVDTLAFTLSTGWISCFCCPQTITSDQGRQFESQLFHSLAKLCVIQLSLSTAHHLSANGLAGRFHWMLKVVIMCHEDKQWTEALPLVLLGIRTLFKADLQASVAELVYGEPLRIPVELLAYIWASSDQFQQRTWPSQQRSCRRTSTIARMSFSVRM